MLILAFAVFNAASAIAAASEYVMVDGERHDVKSEEKFAGIKTLGISAIALGYAASIYVHLLYNSDKFDNIPIVM